MSKVVAVISEYNPFHKGHLHHIDSIRADFGEDTVIIAIMSGNYTQRAECAFADKLLRARCAVDCGVNLVLELPFPYSSASAEFFAASGVSIADRLGIVDFLSFGSELGDIDTLTEIAKNMLSPKFEAHLSTILSSKSSSDIGYPAALEAAYRDCFGGDTDRITTPNNVLALEYIKALLRRQSSIQPHTIKRDGLDYNDATLVQSVLPSATAIRNAVLNNDDSAFDFLPKNAKHTMAEAFSRSEIPCSTERLSPAIISFFRLNSTPVAAYHDAEGGLYNRLAKLSYKTDSFISLTELATTKKYTAARVRRAALFSYLGVTSSDVRFEPQYAQMLAADTLGLEALKSIKKVSKIKIITKPSAIKDLNGQALSQKRLADSADSVFQLTKPTATDGAYHLRFTPYVKK